jgi:large subunit ribosomal protein L9
MEVILLEDVKGLGARGDTVRVADGYARNYLIPSKKAISAAGSGARIFREQEKQRAARENRLRRAAQKMAAEMAKTSCTIPVQVGEDDRVFGSVTAQDIAEALKGAGFEVDKKKILLDEPLKALGVYNVRVKLMADVEARVKVWVVKE